ncbi:MAG: hypothetical protein ACYS8W_03190 [Planctomycetota bacterium]
MRLPLSLIILAALLSGCTTFYGEVISINEDAETVATVKDHSFAKKMVAILESLPAGVSSEGAGDLGVDHTVRVIIEEPGESGQMVIRGKSRQPRSTGYIRRMVRARVKNSGTEITWISGWGARTGSVDSRVTTEELANAVREMGDYTPVYENTPENTGNEP